MKKITNIDNEHKIMKSCMPNKNVFFLKKIELLKIIKIKIEYPKFEEHWNIEFLIDTCKT